MLNSDRRIGFIAMGLIIIIPISILIFLTFTMPSVNGASLSNVKTVGSTIDVIVDADPGADDAMAILLLLSKLSRVNVLAITTVTGNTGVVNGTKNALLILKVANRLDIPVYSGSEQGLVSYVKTDNFFGEDGLGDVFSKKPPLTLRKNGHAAIALADYISKRPGEITVLCTGPVTNIALAQHIYPKFLDNVKEIVILGTSYQGTGNIRPGVEFNTFLDPEAASFMFSKVPPGKTITVVPMEAMESAFTSLDWRINILGRIGSCYMDFMNKAEVISLSKGKIWQPFDQLAASIILKPDIISSTKYSYLFVETCGNHGRGAAFRDDKHQSSNVKLVTGVKREMFKELLITYMNNTSSDCLDLFN